MNRLLRTLGRTVAVVCLACTVGAAGGPAANSHQPAPILAPALQRTGWVTDAAGIIPDDVERRLASKLEGFERRTRHQLVIVTLPTLAGRDVADVAIELGNAWGVGRADHDDGIVLLVAPNERRVRISLGYGMEQLLPNEVCARIVEDTMLPHFREGDLPGGIDAGADALIAHFE